MHIRDIIVCFSAAVIGVTCLPAHAAIPGTLTCASPSEVVALRSWKAWMVKQLKANDPEAKVDMPMVTDILAGDVSALRSELLMKRINPDVQLHPTIVMNMSPLTLAIDACELGAAKVLIEDGANVNGTSPGDSPLTLAAGRGEAAVVSLMVSQGADVNKRDRLGHTALEEAVLNHHYHSSSVLVDQGHADVNQESYGGASESVSSCVELEGA